MPYGGPCLGTRSPRVPQSAAMTETSDGEPAGHAPKFTTDRNHYGPALEAWYRSQFADRDDATITDIDIPVATGFSNETAFFTAEWSDRDGDHRQRYVVRIEPTGGALFPAQTPQCAVSVDVQQRVMATVGAHCDAPVPTVVGYESGTEVMGQPFFVMDFVDGRIPSDNPRYTTEGFVVDEATPAERTTMVETGLEAMAEIHRIDWRSADLAWLDASGTGEPTTAVQIARYRAGAHDALAGRPHPVLDSAFDWLDANDPGDERIGLTWGDARIGNIIWQNYRPAAVVDWEAAALSPTEADLGWWLMFDRMSFDELEIERLDGYPTREAMIEHYASVSGLEVRDPHYWEVFATMRFCAIFIGLGDRLVSAGLMPEETNPAVPNMVTESLARLLEIDNPTPSVL